MKDLERAIESLIEQRVLSGEGLQALADIRSKAIAAENELATAHNLIKVLEDNKKLLTEQIKKQETQINTMQQNINELDTRINEVIEHEKQRAVAEAKASTAIEMFKTVFKAPTFRKSIFASKALGVDSNGYSPVMANENGSEEINEE